MLIIGRGSCIQHTATEVGELGVDNVEEEEKKPKENMLRDAASLCPPNRTYFRSMLSYTVPEYRLRNSTVKTSRTPVTKLNDFEFS